MHRGGDGYLGHCGSTWGVLRLSTAGGVGGTSFLGRSTCGVLGGLFYFLLMFN